MMYDEFLEKCHNIRECVDEPTSTDYAKYIEPVYMYHPMFHSSNKRLMNKYNSQKTPVAELYCDYGLGIFKDMLPLANEFKELEMEYEKARARLLDAQSAVREVEEQAEAMRRSYYGNNKSK